MEEKLSQADIWIKELDKRLIAMGHKPTFKGNKTGSFAIVQPKKQNKPTK